MVKLNSRVLAVSLATLMASAFVLADLSVAADRGLYIEGRAGAVFGEDAQLDATTNQDAEREKGWLGGVGLGYAYGNGLRGEIGVDYRKDTGIDKIGGLSGGGKYSAGSLMISGFYDFFRDNKIQPYIGGGVGAAHVDVDNATPVSGSIVNDDDINFAFQGMAGIGFNVSPSVRLSLGYRYFAVPDLTFKTAAGASVDADYANHEVMLGVRFLFGAPPKAPEPMPVAAKPEPMPEPAPPPKPMAAPEPAPAPPPEPEISRNFLVFFDLNRANITSLAENIIQSAASEAKRARSVRIRLTGHTDRSGTTQYNQRLSLRRANAVSQRLQQLGIAANEIAVIAKGESEPLVATADGVREPQNRRVEILIE